MEQSSSSKVTVEYHDPSGVFPLIAHELANRLPLRNLNWQSSTRPLRQIKHLHVEFVPDAETEAILRPTAASRANVEKPTSIDILRVGAESLKGQGKERKHQIPGLKTTPYLRVYILRCDDKNWYKQEERQKVKTWLREIAPGDSKHEQHDAFQWLIVHVVIPDTIAASEPRWRESTRDPDELKERSKGSNAKWPGKAPKSVFDRLRSDFNDTKADGQRIAQIRLSKSQVAVDLLPVPALGRTIEETADEREKSWSDLMTKIRTSILSSFDSRVRQYEADIIEQESRQSIPGWNFCTFFIHKEGLARALESVGLLEDALTIYDELALGLETIIVDLAAGRASQTATSFLPTGTEIVERILGSSSKSSREPITESASSRRLFDKDYRQEIVRSAVSVFDFFCYLFDRQTALILRLAGRSSSLKSESGIRESGEDLVMLAEICWRGLSFIHNGARTLKQDLIDSSKDLTSEDIHCLVTSWTYSASDFVLERTHSTYLDLSDAGIKTPGKLANGRAQSPRRAEFGFGMGADTHPARTSSLPAKKAAKKATEVKSTTSTSSASRNSDDGFFSPPSSSGADEIRPEVPGLAELGAYRAELIIMKRKMLEELASLKGWHTGWASFHVLTHNSETLPEHSSDGGFDHNTDLPAIDAAALTMIGSDVAVCLKTYDTFTEAFESLTEVAIRHYLSATHSKSAEKLMGDLAILKYREGDLESAATFFEHASPLYKTTGWNYLDAKVLALRVECLERLGRYNEAVLSAASMLVQEAKAQIQQQHQSRSLTDLTNLSSISIDKSGFTLPSLLARSQKCTDKITLPMLDFFDELQLDHEIAHSHDRDGFLYRFRFQHVLKDNFMADQVLLRLISTADAAQELILTSHKSASISHGLVEVEVQSHVSTLGLFLIDSIELHAGNLIFAHSLTPPPKVAPLALAQSSEHDGNDNDTRPSLLVFPVCNALDAEISLANKTALHKSRHIAITLHSGWNEITSLDIKLKPASAGLRIHTTDITLDGVELRPDSSFKTGIIQLGALRKEAPAVVHIRFTLEQAKSEISVKAEITYRTKVGEFGFVTDARLPTQLPIDVEVNDIFQQKALYSTFTVRSMDGFPILLKNVELQGTKSYEVEAPPVVATPSLVLPGHPTELVFIIKRCMGEADIRAEATLEMILDCVSAMDVIKYTLQAALDSKLRQSEFNTYRRLLLPIMTKRFRHAFSAEEFELAMLSNQTKSPSFADLSWFDIIDTLPKTQQRPLSDWLMKWHIEHQRLQIDTETLPPNTNKQFAIAVEVPSLDLAFQTSLTRSQHVIDHDPLIIGAPLTFQLTITASSQWMRSDRNITTAHDFVYSMHVREDVWTVGGQRRARFSIGPDSSTFTVELILVPLKAGLHTLPVVDIQPVLPPEKHDENSASSQKTVSCETSNTHTGHVFRVVHDRRRTAHWVSEQQE